MRKNGRGKERQKEIKKKKENVNIRKEISRNKKYKVGRKKCERIRLTSRVETAESF